MAVFTWKQAFAPLPSRRCPCSTTRGFGIIKQKQRSSSSKTACGMYPIIWLPIQKLTIGHVFLSEALFWPEWRVNLKGCDVAKILSGRACSHKENRRDSTKARRANPSYWCSSSVKHGVDLSAEVLLCFFPHSFMFCSFFIPIREIRGLITSNHMGWYGWGTMGMGSHEAVRAMSYLCTRNQEEKKIRILGR